MVGVTCPLLPPESSSAVVRPSVRPSLTRQKCTHEQAISVMAAVWVPGKLAVSYVHICLQHVCRDAARRAGSSVTADTCSSLAVSQAVVKIMVSQN